MCAVLTGSFPGGGWPVAHRRRDNHHFALFSPLIG